MTCGLCKRPIKGDERYTTDHYQCSVELTDSWRHDVLSAEAERNELRRAMRTILRGFHEGVFVRSVNDDTKSDWAVRLLPFMAALGEGARIVGETCMGEACQVHGGPSQEGQ